MKWETARIKQGLKTPLRLFDRCLSFIWMDECMDGRTDGTYGEGDELGGGEGLEAGEDQGEHQVEEGQGGHLGGAGLDVPIEVKGMVSYDNIARDQFT